MIKKYLEIMKPRMILGNTISIVGGFLLTVKDDINYKLFFFTIFGTLLVMASSCVLNNYIDRDIDKKMERTKNRVLAKELLPLKTIPWYAAILSIIGFNILYFKVNHLVMWLALIGFMIYVLIYTLYMKRKSKYSTIIGSISGSIPPVIGYCSINNQLNFDTFVLFLIFTLWQIPHFYAIAVLYLKDYQLAAIPVFPVTYGVLTTQHHIIVYIICFILSILLLPINGCVNYKIFSIVIIIGIWWLYIACKWCIVKNDNRQQLLWAKKTFILSIVTILTLNIIISINFYCHLLALQ